MNTNNRFASLAQNDNRGATVPAVAKAADKLAAAGDAVLANEVRAEVATAPAVAASAPVLSVRFVKPSYAGKDLSKRENVADAMLIGAFPGVPLMLGGITLALVKPANTISVYLPRAGSFAGSPSAVQPENKPAPDGIDTPDGMVLVTGARGADERLQQSIRDAWAAANVAGSTKWGTAFPLTIAPR